MSLGLLFSGQGTQHPAMLPWLARNPGPGAPLALLDVVLGANWQSQLGDAAWTTRNDIAQPLLTALCLAAWQRLQPFLPVPAVIAGYSVGELAAFSAAGVFDAHSAIELAAQRARIMDDCVRGLNTGLLSIASAAPGLIDRLCIEHGLAVAIRIAPDRSIVGGLVPALLAAEQAATARGATCSRVAISLASHTPWLADGVAPLSRAISSLEFKRPHTPLVCNRPAGLLRSIDELQAALAGQIAETVDWDRCMEAVAERRVSCVLEIGPGSALARMWNVGHPAVPARSIDEFQHPESIAAWVRDNLRA